jgi:hypothetical protein
MRRRPSERMTKTWRTRNLAVRTVKKSHPHVSCRWLRMKVAHRCPRPRLNPEGLYFETVRAETTYPSLASSPRIRSSP